VETEILATVGVRIRGQCPKCRRWFACDDWFDQHVPVPCCPACRLAPAKVEYQTAAGTSPIGVDLVSSEVWLG